jgi:DNA-binding LacI/PurR family transcriptional regulator
MPRRKSTLRDVAQAAGVAISTASRALNRSGRVSPDAIAAVTKAARDLGYEPDAVAQSMRTRSTGVVGMMVSDLANPFYARIVTGMEPRLLAAGYTLLLASTHNDRAHEKTLIDLFRRRRVDGLVLGPCAAESPDMLARLALELPVVALDREFGPENSGVHVDHYNGTFQATRYLLNLGHTRIALLTPASTLAPPCSDAISGQETFPLRAWQAHTNSDSTASMRARSAIFSRTSLSLCSARLLASSQWVPSSSRSSSAISSRLKPSRWADFTKRTRVTSASP